ncbi:MAG: hypothetical protein IJ347_03815, partial [Faecalibacterium sp.]|nr:hypothetical protein [Faecalibacterium sp.]
MMKSGTGKKIGIIAAIVCLLAAVVAGGALFLTGREDTPATVPTTWQTDWYDETGKEFVIMTEEQLYGFAELSKTYSFKGQTIKLGADIVVNEGKASKWGDRAPDKLWSPIVGFAGTFDGQNHTISGVYGNSIVTSLGLFTDTQKGCVIKNLRLENSFFKNNNDMGTGSIIGVGGGTLKNIYSDAILVSNGKYVGGFIGNVKTKGENTISNCWFDGAISTRGYDCSAMGGLVGAYSVEDAINTIEHCLSTADINCLGEDVGGVVGTVASGSFLNLNDSMFSGTLVYDTNKYAVVGSMVGTVAGSGSIIVNDSYTVDELANRTIGTSSGYQKGNAIALDKRYLVGVAGYQWTTLNFDKYWVAQKDGMPRLAYFTKATASIDGVQKMVDISWYDPAGAAFEITNVQQLYGFAYLSRSYDFRGQTIKLGADITVNEGKASNWQKNAPDYGWTPIAWYGSSLSQRFKGTFDGQGHTISGIYCKGTENITSLGLFGEVYHGAVVKNFKLVNSYFEGVLDSSVRGPVGSIAGRLRGTIQNVYSDAIIVNSAKNTGGIVGMVIGTGQNTISSCWFDGKITGITRTGGILGGVYGNKGNIEATIEHCLNTGDIRVAIGEASIGGICGCAETWSILYINDCLNAGTFQTTGSGKNASNHIGTILGTVTQTDGVGSQAVITHSYGVKDFFSRLVGWKYDDKGVKQNSMMYVERDELISYGGYQWTTLNFNKYWAVRANGCPVPAVFAASRPSVANHVRMVDYSWYNPDKDVYTIFNMQQLYGAARLWEVTNLFVDKTILLGADITVNSGGAGDWASAAPAFVWEPMKLRGTFDGQGHVISGIYVKGGAEDNYIGLFHRVYQGGTVRNLRLTNSYFEGTMPSDKRGAVGSIAGRNNGVIDTVYSDAIVVNSARMTGGLVGMITGEGENLISNSWFNGGISAINRTGGILGGLYGNKENIAATIKNCTNTGAIAVKIGSGDVGGICGMAETGGTLYLTNCVNAGIFNTVGEDKEANTHIGSIFGSVTSKDGVSSHVVMNNVYGTKEFYSKLVGWKYDAKGISSTAAVMLALDQLTAEGGYRYAQLDYTNTFGLNTVNVPVPLAFAAARAEGKGLLDYSWYDAAKSEYTLTSAAQLEAFNILCNAENDYFAGKTVKLGGDIKLSDDVTKLTAPNWTPISFKGTFDGQNHTISGVYVKSDLQYAGFFHTVETGASVQNLKLTNSIIEGVYTGEESRAGVGSIVGRNRGTIDGVYSSAIVKNAKAMTGGIAGMSEGGTITNSWFNGEVHGARASGGILGGTYAKAAAIKHCLNTGKIIVADNTYYVGGIAGELQKASAATIDDCLNVGTLTGAAVKSGNVVGRVDADASLALTDSYGVSEFHAEAIGDCTGTLTSTAYGTRSLNNLKGYGAYQWTTLDFDGGSWVLKKDALPALGKFDTTDLSLEEAKQLPSYNLFDASKDEFVITTAEQLLVFNSLCNENTDYYKGKTVKLAADITLTGGSESNPNWQVNNFSGTFDGQGHTISGVYVKSDNEYAGLFGTVNSGAVVKNLRLENSRIEGTYAGEKSRAGVGSIAGRNHGTIENVYSNATVINSKQMTGGIAGMATLAGENKITNCWFDGTIQVAGSTGGILGGSYIAPALVEHCLFTGTIKVEAGTAIGGLVGFAQASNNSSTVETMIIRDSLNAGTFTPGSGTIKQLGAVIGAVHAKAALTVGNVYGVGEFADARYGWVGSTPTVEVDTAWAVRAKANLLGAGAYQWTKLSFADGTWVMKKDSTPVLGVFYTAVADDPTVEQAEQLLNHNWYDESQSEFVITTADQLLSFNVLCNEENDYFKGKTIKLGADITLNAGGNAADWATTEPADKWINQEFKGTFDGQGHTLSGVYVKSGTHAGFFKMIRSGAVVKNFKLVNSYILNTKSGRIGTGSIAGRSYGTIENVYSSAIVSSGAQMTGGIVGMIDA